MDQEPSARRQLAWWTEAVFHDWRNRPGPRYARLAAAILEAIDRKTLREGTRVPAERTLAAAVGVSRGTVVACFDHLTAAGVLTRRQGDGTYVAGRPSWTATAGSVATALLRRIAAERETIDLSASSPGDLGHLPFPIPNVLDKSLDGHGLDPAGLPELRSAVARHLSEHQGLPTSPEQLIITNGAQEALWLLTRILPARTVLTSCPTYPGLASAMGGSRATVVPVPADAAGPDPAAVERAGHARGTRARGSGGVPPAGRAAPEGGGSRAVAFLMPTGHNPTGAVMPLLRRQSLAALADAGRLAVVEDLALADLTLGAHESMADHAAPPPLSALSSQVIAVGSASKLLWGGLRVGWIRVGDEPLRGALIGRKAALNLATSAVSQSVTAQLLASVTLDWLARHRAALARRRDHLVALIGEQLPAWRVTPPAAGLSLWAELPLASADAFTHAAARHGVTITPGSTACVCGGHGNYARLSFAEQPGTLESRRGTPGGRLGVARPGAGRDLGVLTVQGAGRKGRLVLALDLDGEVNDHLHAARDVGHRVDDAAEADLRADLHRAGEPQPVQPVVHAHRDAADLKEVVEHRDDQRERQVAVRDRGAERAAAARSASMWIHWWSPVASAKRLTRSWVTSSHALLPRSFPARALISSSPFAVLTAISAPLCRYTIAQTLEGAPPVVNVRCRDGDICPFWSGIRRECPSVSACGW